MFKSILIGGVIAFSSMSSFAMDKVSDNTLLNVDLTDKAGLIHLNVYLRVGDVSPTAVTKGDPNRDTKCNLKWSENGVSNEFVIEQKHNEGTIATIYPMELDGKKVKLMMMYEKIDEISSEKAVDITDNCKFANGLSNVTKLQWIGDVELNKRQTIPLSGGNLLYVVVKKAI